MHHRPTRRAVLLHKHFLAGGDAWKVLVVLWALTYIANEVVSTVWFPSDHSQGLGHHEAVLEKQYRKHTADRQ